MEVKNITDTTRKEMMGIINWLDRKDEAEREDF